MRVICPHCQTIYQLHTLETDAVLVCHRCGTEFGMGEMPDGAQEVDTASVSEQQTQDMFTQNTPDDSTSSEPETENDAVHEVDISSDDALAESTQESEEGYDAAKIYPTDNTWQDGGVAQDIDEQADDEKETDDLPASPPQRAKARIMPWLIAVVLLIAGGGFWMNHDAWLDNPWLRSVLINAGIDMQIRDKDWHVDPDSVSAIWLERQGGETVLVITAEVQNKLQSSLLPPLIHITLYARDNPDELILERDLIITRPPLMQAIRQAPYSPPLRDNTEIAALGKRGFVLVLEDLPQNAGNFSLQAKAR